LTFNLDSSIVGEFRVTRAGDDRMIKGTSAGLPAGRKEEAFG
jgi:hypothetical protein